MFDQFGFETLTPRAASVIFALAIGLIFGAIGQHTRFCFRRAIAGELADCASARAVWFTALATAILGTQASVALDLISFSEHRFFVSELPVLAIAVGGMVFGAGMVLTRGCISRLTILSGTGNLRALIVMIVFAVVAHATLKGVFAPLRTSLGAFTLDLGDKVAFSDLPGGAGVWSVVLAGIAVSFAFRSGAKPVHLVLAVLLGLLVPFGWVGTGYILLDDFDPIVMQSLSFTSPSADLLFWSVASTSIPAGFGVGLVGGVVAGSSFMSLVRGEFHLQSFESPKQTLRYVAGGILMGFGGVLAGGCTVGAGLSGVPTLGFSAVIALSFITVGALGTRFIIMSTPFIFVQNSVKP